MITAIVIVFVIIAIVVIVYFTYNTFSKKTEFPGVISPGVDLYKKIEEESAKRKAIGLLVPTYVSSDEYKDIKDAMVRNKRVFDDYFYLLDLAIRSYYENINNISNYKTDPKCISILVFVKYIIDYDVYVRDINPKELKMLFDVKYSRMPDILKTMEFFNKAAIEYSKDKSGFNSIIFGTMVNKVVMQECPFVNAKGNIVCQENVVYQEKMVYQEKVVYQEKIVYQEKPYILKNSLGCDLIPTYIQTDIYKNMTLESRNAKILEDIVVILRSAIKNYYEYKNEFTELVNSLNVNFTHGTCNQSSSNNNALYNTDKYLRILVAVKYLLVYNNYANMIPIAQKEQVFNQFSSENEAFSAFSKLIFYAVFDFNNFMTSFNKLLEDNCNKLKPQSCTAPPVETATLSNDLLSLPVKKEMTNYAMLPSQTRDQSVLNDLKDYFKNAVESLIASKEQLYDIFLSRKSSDEFLEVANFIPALKYARFVEINKDYLNQLGPSEMMNVSITLYPDFNSNPMFFVQGLHINAFIMIATNIYTESASKVDDVLYKAGQFIS